MVDELEENNQFRPTPSKQCEQEHEKEEYNNEQISVSSMKSSSLNILHSNPKTPSYQVDEEDEDVADMEEAQMVIKSKPKHLQNQTK